jgi:thiosulfate/3-mercaptopyruvate sulfurtransferase
MKRRNRCTGLAGVVLFLLTFFILTPSEAKPPPIKNFRHPRLVEVEELQGLVQHPSVRIVDMRTSLPDYLKGHIPNAVHLQFENLRIPENGIPAQAPDRICLERLLGHNLSIANDMWVIIYSERSNPNATFLAWTLDFLGHMRMGILNGGWEKWVAEGLPTTQTYPALVPKKFFGKIKRISLAEKKWVRAHLEDNAVIVVDARPPNQYRGDEREEIRRGHIPGARNVFWETTLEGNEIKVWKKRDDLIRLFSEQNITKEKEIVVYCRTGRKASHVYFTLRYVLGFPKVRLYRGSWVEWSADRTLPIKTGLDP